MQIDTSNRKVLAARVVFAVLSGLVVASSSAKWVLTRGHDSMSFGDAIEKASAGRAALAICLGLVVTIGNGCQYFNGIQDNTTNVKRRTKDYLAEHSAGRIAFEASSTVILSLLSGAALGTLYQEEFKSDNDYLRIFVFVYMTAIGVTFTREVNYNFASGICELEENTKEKILSAVRDVKNDIPRFLTWFVSLTMYYFLFAKNNEEIIQSMFSDDSPNYSLSNLIAWGIPTLFVSATFAKLTSLSYSRLAVQLRAIKQDYNNDERRSALVKLLYFVVVNPLALLSTASLFVGLNDEVEKHEYNALGWIGKNFQYFVTPFCILSNISALAQVFNDLLFTTKRLPLAAQASGSGSGSLYGAVAYEDPEHGASLTVN